MIYFFPNRVYSGVQDGDVTGEQDSVPRVLKRRCCVYYGAHLRRKGDKVLVNFMDHCSMPSRANSDPGISNGLTYENVMWAGAHSSLDIKRRSGWKKE